MPENTPRAKKLAESAPVVSGARRNEGTGQITYDLRRLRLHGLITRRPGTHRYQVTDTGLHHALFLTRAHDRLLRGGLAQLADPGPARLRRADRAYQDAVDDLVRESGLAA